METQGLDIITCTWFTNSSGNEFIVRGGPLNTLDRIDVETGHYDSSSSDWEAPDNRNVQDSRVLLSGSNLEETYLTMAFHAQLIEEVNIDYNTLSVLWGNENSVVNSNTTATSASDYGFTKFEWVKKPTHTPKPRPVTMYSIEVEDADGNPMPFFAHPKPFKDTLN